ncbi:putative EF-hand domain pair protein [Rosa chinensis]|uniref:Putative EF-hand domain pair protein n=1 Tax=Rosa chinensis TaxID=74649 RepID=A0A2P6PYB3_ROSCH|nr:putative EF-hand domain pair protein [Rosa chinensis]
MKPWKGYYHSDPGPTQIHSRQEEADRPLRLQTLPGVDGDAHEASPFNHQLRNTFKVLDKDATYFVSVSELRHILTSIGEKLEVFPKNFGAGVVVGGASRNALA